MAFYSEQAMDPYLFDTEVENLFIGEYMGAAPGEYVKIFLLGLMYAKTDREADEETLARQALVSVEDVRKAWTYWAELGAIKKRFPDPEDSYHYDVEFVSLKERLYSDEKSRARSTAAPGPERKEIRAMYQKIEKSVGRLLGGGEYPEISSWLTEYNASPELIAFAYKYSVKNFKKDSVRYIGKIVRDWSDRGLKTEDEIEKYLAETDSRHRQYRRVMKALGFTRNATEQERLIMDRWFGEYAFSLDAVLEACAKTSGISNPNINYVNSILERRYKEEHGAKTSGEKASGAGAKKISENPIALTQKYYAELRERAKRLAAEHREEINEKIPEILSVEEKSRASFVELTKAMTSRGSDRAQRIERLKTEIAKLEDKKRGLLRKNGYPADYLELAYKCRSCKDTGMRDDGSRCECFEESMNEAAEWAKTNRNNLI